MKMKPLPKALLIAAVVGALGYGATFVLPKKVEHKETATAVSTTKEPERIEVEPVTKPVTESTPPKVVLPEVEQARNAGLDKLLNSGTK